MLKKLIPILLALLLMLSSACAESFSDEAAAGMLCGDSLTWSIEGSTLTITGTGDMYDFADQAPWSAYRYSINRVVIGNGVTSIGANAFNDYDGIYQMEIGSDLVRIGANAMYSCDNLTSLTLPRTFKKFGENSLRSCKNLREIHCSGNFPRFDENCLWDTYCKIIFSASNPWSVIYIEQLETAFKGRIEFLSSDGTDPYTPTEATAATEPVTVYIPETYPTAPTYPVYETAPATEYTVYTEPTYYTAPPETIPVQTAPPTEATQETLWFSTQPTAAPTAAPADSAFNAGSGIFGLIIVMLTLAIIFTGILIFRTANSSRRKKRKKRRKKKSR